MKAHKMVPRRPASKRRRGSRGNMWVEMALIMLPFFALITAFFDVSYVIFSWGTIQNAVREGCRYAITYQTTLPSYIPGKGSPSCSGSSQDACIDQVVSFYAMGLVPPNSSLIHIDYYQINNTVSPQTITLVTGAGSNAPGNVVQISVQGYPLNWMIPLSGTTGGVGQTGSPYRGTSPTSISVYSSDIMGAYPAGVSSVTR